MLFEQFVAVFGSGVKVNPDNTFSGTYNGFGVKGKRVATLPIADIDFYAKFSSDKSAEVASFNSYVKSKYQNAPMKLSDDKLSVLVDFNDKNEVTAKGLIDDVTNFLMQNGAVPVAIPQSVPVTAQNVGNSFSSQPINSSGNTVGNTNTFNNNSGYAGNTNTFNSNSVNAGNTNTFNSNRANTNTSFGATTAYNTTSQQPQNSQIPQSTTSSTVSNGQHEDYVKGIIGSVVGTALGMVVWIILAQLGVISVFGAICIAGGALFGYMLAAKDISKVTLIVSIILLLIAVPAANYLSLTITVMNEFDFSFGLAWDSMSALMSMSEVKSAYIKDLVIGYIMSFLAVFWLVRKFGSDIINIGSLKK